MKIIIDINDNEYIGIKGLQKENTSYPWTLHLYGAVKNATPLSEMFEEIKEEIRNNNIADFIAVQSVIDIINKHIEKE